MSIILFISILVVLLITELAYRSIALRKGWTTGSNRRRDGHPVTPIGGGIIFCIGMVLWSLSMAFIYEVKAPRIYFLTGLTMLTATSFADDLMRLPVWFRLVVQFVAVAFLCFCFNASYIPVWMLLLYILATVAFINGYNFMDGINGMTAAYSVVVLTGLLYTDLYRHPFVSGSIIAIALGAAAIFGIFNFRRQAKIFAGDVGSISMGFIVTLILTLYIIESGNIYGLVMVAVYCVDIFATILRRIIEGENIFRAHRKHIYERLCFVWRVPQLVISSVYALLQIIITTGYFMMSNTGQQAIWFYSIFTILAIVYLVMMILTDRRIRNRKLKLG